jgi:hypothetical protein
MGERMVETPAELPFIRDQVGLFRAQPGRPKRPATVLGEWKRWNTMRAVKIASQTAVAAAPICGHHRGPQLVVIRSL